MTQPRTPTAGNLLQHDARIIGFRIAIDRGTQIESKLRRLGRLGIVVRDVERRAHMRRQAMLLAPGDESANRFTESVGRTAMLENCNAYGFEMDNLDGLRKVRWRHVSVPQLA